MYIISNDFHMPAISNISPIVTHFEKYHIPAYYVFQKFIILSLRLSWFLANYTYSSCRVSNKFKILENLEISRNVVAISVAIKTNQIIFSYH